MGFSSQAQKMVCLNRPVKQDDEHLRSILAQDGKKCYEQMKVLYDRFNKIVMPSILKIKTKHDKNQSKNYQRSTTVFNAGERVNYQINHDQFNKIVFRFKGPFEVVSRTVYR